MVAPPNSHTAPAPSIYLCQVNATTACGACCGLYNVADNSRFKDGTHGRPPFVSTLKDGVTGGLYKDVFKELATTFNHPDQECAACNRLDRAIDAAAAALRQPALLAASPPQPQSNGDGLHATP